MKSIEYSYFDRKETDKITDFQNTSKILLFHTLGVFKTSRSAKTSIEAKFGSYIRLDLEHQVYDLLDIEGEPCNTGEINIRKMHLKCK